MKNKRFKRFIPKRKFRSFRELKDYIGELWDNEKEMYIETRNIKNNNNINIQGINNDKNNIRKQ